MMAWEMVPDMDCVFQWKGPKVRQSMFWPLKQLVQESAACPFGHCLQGSFCHSILVMCSNSTVVYLLVLQFKVGLELGGSKWGIVCSEMFQLDPKFIGKSFVGVFCL